MAPRSGSHWRWHSEPEWLDLSLALAERPGWRNVDVAVACGVHVNTLYYHWRKLELAALRKVARHHDVVLTKLHQRTARKPRTPAAATPNRGIMYGEAG